MWYVDLTFNMVTSISVVLAVGIAVDYAVHITHNFLVQSGTKVERATLALQNIGGEVFCAAFTSLLAVVGLGFTKHYVMQVCSPSHRTKCSPLPVLFKIELNRFENMTENKD